MLSLNTSELQCLDQSLLFLCSTTDIQLQLLYSNRLFRDSFCFNETASPGISWLDATGVVQREKCIAAIKECLRHPGHMVQVETAVHSTGVEERWFRWEISSLPADDQTIQGLCFVGTDISLQKNNERQLLTTKEKLLSAVGQHTVFMNALTEGVVVMNHKSEILECNTAAEKILGLSASQIRGIVDHPPDWKSIHEDGSAFAPTLHPSLVALQTGKPQRNIIIGLQKPDGILTWICVNAQPVFGKGQGSGPTEVVCSFADITRMKRTELALRKSEHRWKFALEGAGDGVWEYNILTGEIYYSHLYKKMIGYNETEFKNEVTEWRNRIHPDDLYKIEDIEARYKACTIDRHAVEYRIRNKSGNYSWVLDRGMVIERTAEGKPLKIIGTNKDITQCKKEEENRALAEASKKKEIIEAIIGAQERERQEISFELHDNVNQLLSTGMLVLDVAEKHPAHAKEYILQSKNAIQKAIDEIRKITHNLNPATLDFVGLTASIQDVMKEINPTGKLHISFIQEGLVNERAIAPAIQLAVFRIIQEQLTNIIKHSRASQAALKLVQTDTMLRLEIRDNGIGFDLQGTPRGLGLSNIFTRVEHYKGNAVLDTTPGKGCLLLAELPVTTK